MGSPRRWKQHGSSGLWVSDWLPEIAGCADELAVIRSCWTDAVNHAGAVYQMNCGTPIGGRPSLGSWVSYGLGTENQDLPAFVVLLDSDTKRVFSGVRNWGPGFLPAVYQGTRLSAAGAPIRDLEPPAGQEGAPQRGKLELLEEINRHHAEPRSHQDQLEARIRSYQLAFRMQAAAPEAVDLASETAETRRLYGMDDEETATFGRNCLLARRLVERGRPLRAALPRRRQPLGLARQHRAAASAPVPLVRSAGRRPAPRPQAPGSSRRDAGRLGRRVRPHADRRDQYRPRGEGAGPQPDRLHHVDGRRRRAGRADRSGRPTSWASRRSRIGSMSSTSTPRSCT